MRRSFYFWLLFSLLANSFLFARMKYPAMAGMAVPGNTPEMITVFLDTPTVTPPVVVVPPTPLPTPVPARRPERITPALPVSIRPTPGVRVSPIHGTTTRVGTMRPDKHPVRVGKIISAAPKVITSPTGTRTVPTGTDNGPGTNPTGADTPAATGGPTYGSTVQGSLPKPRYSKDDQNMGYEGTVVISVLFNTAGVVTNAEFSRKCPYASLNDKAMIAAKKAHYHAGMINGLASSGSDTLTYTFMDDGHVIVNSTLL